MNDECFDRLARLVALGQPHSRRRLLRALGVGGGAVAFAARVPGAAGQTPPSLLSGVLPDATPAPEAAAPSDRPPAASDQPTPSPVDDLASSLDYDPEQAFAFVRDRVAYDPYPGVLRGANGALWGLAGNAADQAILLAGLLEAGMVQTRFVAGELTEAGAAALLAAGTLPPEAAKMRATSLFAPPADEDIATPSALTPEQDAIAQQFPDFTKRVLALIDGHLRDGVATVSDALKQAGIALPVPAPALPDLERTQHVWLQYANGADWVDLDPSVPNAKPGDVFAANPQVLDALPDAWLHRVKFRLIAEQVSGGAAASVDLLAYEAASRDLVGVPVTLMHPQPEAMSRVGVAISGLIEGFRNFVPSLLVGEETIFGTPVTFSTGGGVLDTPDGGAMEGETLAEWLEVTVTTPTSTATATRTVFDRVGAEARAAGPVDPTQVAPVDLVQSDQPESSFLPLAGLWSFAVTAGDIPASLTVQTIPAQPTASDRPPGVKSYQYARAAHALRTPALAGVRIFRDAPNVAALVQRPTKVEADTKEANVGLDLFHRSIAVAPGAATTEVHPLVAGGVLAHAVEQAMFEAGGMAPVKLPVNAASGVSRVFAEAKAQGIATVVLGADDAKAPPPQLAVGPRQLIEEALNAGRIVIVPQRPVQLGGRGRIGWWLVDPNTGATVDQMDDGGGSTMGEYATLLSDLFCAAALMGLALLIGATARLAVAGLNDSATASRTSTAAGAGAVAGLGGLALCAG